jgi:hypothetical protein
MLLVILLAAVAAQPAATVARCSVSGDPRARVFELQRTGEGKATAWRLAMRDAEGGAPVLLPLPDASPDLGDGRLSLEYRTLNGGRTVSWKKGPETATLDVYANYELEVNVDADLDPRVDRMNTEGPVACSL